MNAISLHSATNFYGLHTAVEMLLEEGLTNLFARHNQTRGSDAPGSARLGFVKLMCHPGGIFQLSYRRTATTRDTTLTSTQNNSTASDMSLGMGLGKLQGKIFRIGHLGFLTI
jgi:alanine-glyoxylate transaminase/serine-glyoxylate transaminase/serine-pyruvate transaminase